MPAVEQYIVFDDFRGGQKDSVDPQNLPRDSAQSAWNVDFTRSKGTLCRAFGATEYTGIINPLPSDLNILSLGRLVYNKVWDGNDKVNERWEMVVIQYDGDNGFDWYEAHRRVGATSWMLEGPYHCGWDSNGNPTYSAPQFRGEWGVTKAGRVRWIEHSGVLRAACGSFIAPEGSTNENTSDSFPIQWRYINRYPADGDDPQGFFQEYRYTSPNYGTCYLAEAGLWRGRSLPRYNPSLSYLDKYQSISEMGFSSSNTTHFHYAAIPVFDGHQIGIMVDDPVNFILPKYEESAWEWAFKLRISIPDYANEDSFPRRMSAIKIYRAWKQPRGSQPLWGNYTEAAHIDIKDGSDVLWAYNGELEEASVVQGTMRVWLPQSHQIHDDLFVGLYIRIYIDDDTYEEYEITDSSHPAPNYENLYITFTPPAANTGLVEGNDYAFEIYARWKPSGDDMILDFVDFNQVLGAAPPWILAGKEPDDQPEAECNYGAGTVFKDRLWVWDVAYDDVKSPGMLRFSNPVNAEFAGFDLFPNYIIPSVPGDENIVGVFNYLDYLLIFTRRRILRYLISADGSVDAIAELLWDVGCESIDSMREVNGIIYFFGRIGELRTLFVWNPNSGRPPIDIGELNRSTLDELLGYSGVNSEMAHGIYVPHEKKYILNIPVFE
jgi:hypothetical protein